MMRTQRVWFNAEIVSAATDASPRGDERDQSNSVTSTSVVDPAKQRPGVDRNAASIVSGVWMIDHRPLAQLFLQNRDRLLRYLRGRGGGDDAEDLLQELWLKVDADRDVTIAQPASYLFRMAHNLMLDRLRAAHRRAKREQAYHEGEEDIDQTPDAVHTLLARERLREVAATLAALGSRTDEIFRLYRVDGFAQRDIAERFDISLSAVEKHLQKAYRALAGLPDDVIVNLVASDGDQL